MVRRFAAFPDALARTEEIAGRCGAALPDGHSIWPRCSYGQGAWIEKCRPCCLRAL
jgi:hypothetical protein